MQEANKFHRINQVNPVPKGFDNLSYPEQSALLCESALDMENWNTVDGQYFYFC